MSRSANTAERCFFEHAVSVFGSHIVQIDVDGESGHIVYEEVQGRAALEDQLSFEKGVTPQGIQQPQEVNDLFHACLQPLLQERDHEQGLQHTEILRHRATASDRSARIGRRNQPESVDTRLFLEMLLKG